MKTSTQELNEPKGKNKQTKEGARHEHEGTGYMAIYHDIEEMNYGPLFGMPAKWRVFFCIRHKLLRDGLCEKHIGTEFIIEKTELTKSQIKAAIKYLQKEGLIIITQNSKQLRNGKIVYGENSYALNPVFFGDLYNWYKNNPTVRVYDGSKGRSFSQKGPVPNLAPGGVSDLAPGGVSDLAPVGGINFSELLAKSRSKNPSSNNPKEKNPISKAEESFTLKGKSETEIMEEKARKRAEYDEYLRANP